MDNDQVYKCAEPGHAGSLHLAGDGHDGEQSNYQACGATVALDWKAASLSKSRLAR